MTGQELYGHFSEARILGLGLGWIPWEMCEKGIQELYNDVASRLTVVPTTNIKEAAVALPCDEQQSLYKFLHDACGCRMY